MMTLAIGCGQSSSISPTPIPATPTPTPPEKYFPAAFAGFNLSSTPKYNTELSKNCACQHFESIYSNGNIASGYDIEIYKSPEEARQALEAKKYLKATAEVTKKSETELIAITKINGGVTTARLSGVNLIIVSGRKAAVVAVENNLPYQALGIAKPPPPRKIEEFLETSALASLVQKEFETNQAEATKKYGANFVLLKGKVADFGDEIETKTVTENAQVRPTPTTYSTPYRSSSSSSKLTTIRRTISRITNSLAKTPTPKTTTKTKTVETHHPFIVLNLPVKGGEPIEIWCYFDSLEVKKIMELKAEQEILFRGKITFVEGKIKISDAHIEDAKDAGVK